MQIYKNIIVAIAFCTFIAAHARQMGGITAPQTIKPIPALPERDAAYNKAISALPAKTYKQLHDDIGDMKSDYVIGSNGLLSDAFIAYIKENTRKSHLAPVFTQALLQAGFNLHSNFAPTAQATKDLFTAHNNVIKKIMSDLFPPATTKDESNITLPQQQSAPQEKHGVEKDQPQPTSQLPLQPVIQQPLSPMQQIMASLKQFRQQGLQWPINTFYANNTINPNWMAHCLRIVLNGAPLTTRNKPQMEGLVIGNALELIREFSQQKQNMHIVVNSSLDDHIKKQVIAFMNMQPLQDQPLPQVTFSPKTESLQPQAAEPIQQPAKPAAKNFVQQMPTWIDAAKNIIINKEFEVELLNYIFKNQDADVQEALDYFTKQLPINISDKNNIIKSMKAIIQKIMPESELTLEKNSPQQQEQAPLAKPIAKEKLVQKEAWPSWLLKEHKSLLHNELKDQVFAFLAHNTDADNAAIIKHFVQQIPPSVSNKMVLERQIKATINSFLRPVGQMKTVQKK